jgi:O-antigen/teichoic acid export membrane protein
MRRSVAAEARPGIGRLTAGRLSGGSAAALCIFIVSAGLAYCVQLAIARIVGAEGYGEYAYVLAWVTVLAYCAALGFDVSLLRFVPAYRAQREFGLMRGVLRYSQRIVVIAGVTMALLSAGWVAAWSRKLTPGLPQTFFIGLALIPVWALLWVRCSIARAFGGIISALTPERIARDALLLCLLGIAGPILGWRISAAAAMGATVVSSLIALCLMTIVARHLQSAEFARMAPVDARTIWLRTAIPLVLIGTVEPLMNRLGVMLLGWVGDIKGAGIYAIVFNMAFLAMLPRTAVNILFAPKASELFARNDQIGLQNLVSQTSVWMLAGSFFIALPLWLLASPILAWFGPGFVVGATALRILLIAQVLIACAGSQLYVMTMTGHERWAALLVTSSAVFNVLIGVTLVRTYGLTGAALATAAAFLAWNLAMGLFVWHRLRLVPGVFGIFSYGGLVASWALAPAPASRRSRS